MLVDPPLGSCGGMPNPKSLPQSTKGHQKSASSSPSGRWWRKNQSSVVRVPASCSRTKDGSSRYIQKSWIIPIHNRENVGICWNLEVGERLSVMPSGTLELLNLGIAWRVSRSSPATE